MAERDEVLRRSRALARLLDDSIPIPGTGMRIGLDALIGLVPGIGDLIGGALSTYIVTQAVEQGVPKATVMRMITNVLIETVIGTVPLLGDLFDAAWKANVRNAKLLAAALEDGRPRGRHDALFMASVIAILVGASLAVTALAVWILLALKQGLTS